MDIGPIFHPRSWCSVCFQKFLWHRLGAFLVDSFLGFLIGVISLIFLFLWLGEEDDEALSSLAFLAFISFLVLKDGLGRPSPGKAFFGLEVVKEVSGLPPGFHDTCMRNSGLFIPPIFLIELTYVFRGQRRLGDKAASTWVVWKDHQEAHKGLETVRTGLRSG